MTEEQKRTSVR